MERRVVDSVLGLSEVLGLGSELHSLMLKDSFICSLSQNLMVPPGYFKLDYIRESARLLERPGTLVSGHLYILEQFICGLVKNHPFYPESPLQYETLLVKQFFKKICKDQ